MVDVDRSTSLARDAELLKSTVREAGTLPLSMFRTELKNWTKGASSPSPGSYNLHMEAGAMTPAELMSDIQQGFYVTDLIGSGVNGVTGDYSRGASGFWIENGKITYPVSEVTIAGHLLGIFKSMVPANDLSFRYGVNAPTLRIEGLTLGGR